MGAPGILGINSGAAFAIVTAIHLLGVVSPSGYIWFVFLGALGAASLVYAIASAGSGGPTPFKLAMAGAVITALLGSWTTTLLLFDQETLDQARFWLAGSVAGRDHDELTLIAPIIVASLAGSLLMGRHINTLNLGDDVAVGLGQRVALVRTTAGLLVVLLAGSAVAIAGPISFVGLAVPHMVRAVVGAGYRRILPFSLITGPCLLLGADVVGRVVVRPGELQVGIVTAAVGDWYGEQPYAVWLWAQDELGDATPEVMPASEINMELITSLNPDLIVGVSSGMTEDDYNTLSQIAPTLPQSGEYADWSMPWDARTLAIGTILGKEAEAQQYVDDLTARFEQIRSDYPEFAGATAAVAFTYDGSPGAYASGDARSTILCNMGFTIPSEIDELAGGAFSFASPLSLNYLLDILVPELALAVDGDASTVVPSMAAIGGDWRGTGQLDPLSRWTPVFSGSLPQKRLPSLICWPVPN